MKFKVEKLKQAEKEYSELTDVQKNAVKDDYILIEEKGIEFVKRRHLKDALFEIKTNDVRSLFQYREGKVILVGLIYTKRGQKTPNDLIKLAHKRLKEE